MKTNTGRKKSNSIKNSSLLAKEAVIAETNPMSAITTEVCSMPVSSLIKKIDADAIHIKVALGSLVQTNDMLFYISAALPKIQLENKTIIAVSPQSPLGSQLLGKSVGDEIVINTNRFQIKAIE